MKQFCQLTFWVAVFLVMAPSVWGQRFFSSATAPSVSGFGGGFSGYSDSSWGSGMGGYNFPGYSSSIGSRFADRPSNGVGVGYAHGDEDFVPSQYMDWDAAVTLGKKILAEQAAPKSLGEIAREYRRRKRPVPPPARIPPTTPPAMPKQG